MGIDGYIKVDTAKLHQICESRSLTLEELGTMSCLSRVPIRRLESEEHRKVKLRTVRKFAEALEVELWDLIA